MICRFVCCLYVDSVLWVLSTSFRSTTCRWHPFIHMQAFRHKICFSKSVFPKNASLLGSIRAISLGCCSALLTLYFPPWSKTPRLLQGILWQNLALKKSLEAGPQIYQTVLLINFNNFTILNLHSWLNCHLE